MAVVTNVSNELSGLSEVEQDDCFTDAARDEIVFRCCERLHSLLISKKWQEIGYTLTAVSEALLKPHNRERLPLWVLDSLGKILHASVAEFKVGPTLDVATAVTETFRALRNSCVGQPNIQKAVTEKTVAVDETCNILKTLSMLESSPHCVTCLRVGAQFLGNLVVNNKETQIVIWSKCSDILIDLLKYEDKKVANYSSMAIYNIVLGCPDIRSLMADCDGILELLIDNAVKDSEFALFTVELLLSDTGYLPKVYENVDAVCRLFMLECLQSVVSTDSDTCIPVTSVMFLVKRFKDCCDCILKTCEKYVEVLEPIEVSKLLQLLASVSANSKYQSEMQKNSSLLITCSMLLRSMHSLGKMGDNHFSAVQKLANLSTSTQCSDIREHPAFGFKSCLVQIVGNLCWKHPENQNQVRELDCVAVLLDCCNIDARNPLIIQWVVLAIRNLCENNLENQAVIASMTRKGVVDSSVLLEMGLTLHADDDSKIVVMPLNRQTSP